MDALVPIRWDESGAIVLLDQTLLPGQERWLRIETVAGLCEAIVALRVRGAPLLGLAGAYGMALAARIEASDEGLKRAAEAFTSTRPTAVDLGRAVRRALDSLLAAPAARRAELGVAMAVAMHERQWQIDRALGEHGAALLPEGARVLTHCNTGMLATGALGSALGVVRAAHEAGRLAHCYATETRPLLQGARLTAWELGRLGIPYSLLVDGAGAGLIAGARVDAVITGADRVAANGDTANKVGTYALALAAHAHRVPFYIAAPVTTLDAGTANGTGIPIEQRGPGEVRGHGGFEWAPDGAPVWNPAFDVTPAALIAGIVTECGVLRPPYKQAIEALSAREDT